MTVTVSVSILLICADVGDSGAWAVSYKGYVQGTLIACCGSTSYLIPMETTAKSVEACHQGTMLSLSTMASAKSKAEVKGESPQISTASLQQGSRSYQPLAQALTLPYPSLGTGTPFSSSRMPPAMYSAQSQLQSQPPQLSRSEQVRIQQWTGSNSFYVIPRG